MRKDDSKLVEKFKKTKNRLLLLDYDGTLVEHVSEPKKAKPSKHLLDILLKLGNKPNTKVIIISGRNHRELEKLLGHLPIDIIAEHGALIKRNGKWVTSVIDTGAWKKAVLSIMNKITTSCPKSYLEEKHFSITWHYRNVEPDLGYTQSRELIRILGTIVSRYNLKTLDGNKVVEIMTNEVGKGKTVKNIVEQNSFDYILSIGDDKTDEEMFEMLLQNDDAYSVKVGMGSTLAKYRFNDVEMVIALLEQLLLTD